MRLTAFLSMALAAVGITCASTVTLVHHGAPRAQIALAEPNAENLSAARLLDRFVARITGDSLAYRKGKPKKGDVVIGEKSPRAGYDGFEINNGDGLLRIKTGGGRGAVYGVATLLEDYLGVDYWAAWTYDFTPARTLVVPDVNQVETPAFRHRQSWSYGLEDPDYRDWFRLRMPDDAFAGGLWVHTFNKLLPAAKYGARHPEWYAMDEKGRRIPGNYSQWCLTNDELYEKVCEIVDSVFKAHPGMTLLSISQNDRDESYCRCEECMKVLNEEGSPSGSLIRFLNRLAARFPDKEFSTLAYQYSMHPPRHVKPLPNVNIMLCDIGCMREKPLTETSTGQDFVKALQGWSAISDNIFIWDYGINFDNMITPFPNFHVLQPNIRLFRDNHATMLHEQVNGHRGVDMSEMRAYVLGKLMWNPEQNVDSLVEKFMDGYYKAAAPYVYQYHALRQEELEKSGTRLWIYDTPVTHKDGMLSKKNIREYNRLFDKALEAVKGDSALTARVWVARLPVIYSDLEIERSRPIGERDNELTIKKLELFDSLTTALNVTAIKEYNNSPHSYVNLYKERYLPSTYENMAHGARFQWINEPVQRYMTTAEADSALTDGLFGGYVYQDSWTGWVSNGPAFILDMGEEKEFSRVRMDFLHQPGSWILYPLGGKISISSDGSRFDTMGSFTMPEERGMAAKFAWGGVKKDTPVKARYVKVEVENMGTLPQWHLGAGNSACLFMDEVEVLK